MTVTPVPALTAHWDRFTATAPGAAALRRWSAGCADLASLDHLGQLVGLVHNNPDLDLVDRVLGHLLHRAARTGADDRDACQALLVLLTPGLSRLSRTLPWLGGTAADRETAVLSTAAILIRSCTWWPRRRRAVAKNLLMDTHMLLRRGRARQPEPTPAGLLTTGAFVRWAQPPGTSLPGQAVGDGGGLWWPLRQAEPSLWDTPAGEARLELLHLLAWAQRTGVLTGADLRLLVDLDLRGVGEQELGRRLHIAAASVRRRRNRALTRLRCAYHARPAATGPGRLTVQRIDSPGGRAAHVS